MNAFFFWTLLALSYVHKPAEGKLEVNLSFEEVDCSILPSEEYCTKSKGWCVWNEVHALCEANYDPILFISTWDIASMPRSLVTYVVVAGCMVVYWLSGVLVRYMFDRVSDSELDSDKIAKCQLYMFELIGLTCCVVVLLKGSALDVIFFPEKYANMSPEQLLQVSRSYTALLVLLYMYAIELLVGGLRFSLKVHHIVSIFTVGYWVWLLDDFLDLAGFRVGLAMTLYAFSEHNVFAQLLLYRFAPLFCWQLHFVSAVFYAMTRIFVIATVTYCYVDWASSDTLKNQLNGTAEAHYPYLIGFFFVPVSNILMNLAQVQSVQALFYVSKSVKSRAKERNALLKYPRLQQLYDIFIEFDLNDKGHWDMTDFKRFIFYHSTFIKGDTVLILWTVLGFSAEITADASAPDAAAATAGATADDDDDEEALERNHARTSTLKDIVIQTDDTAVGIKRRQRNMRWKDVRKIFGEHVKSEKFQSYSVRQLISAQLQVLVETVFTAQSQFAEIDDLEEKNRAMKQLYSDVNGLIDSKRSKAHKHERTQTIENYFATASGNQLLNIDSNNVADLESPQLHKAKSTDTARILTGSAVERQLRRNASNALLEKTFVDNLRNLPLVPNPIQEQTTV